MEFLRVNPTFKPNFERVNVRKKLRFSKLKVLIRSRKLRKLLFLPKYTLPKRVRITYVKGVRLAYAKILDFFDSHVFIVNDPGARMDSQLRRRLMKKFKPEVERLSNLTGRDLISLWEYGHVQ